MNNNRLGCLTSTGIFSAIITTLAIAGVAFASGSQMFTAGALNAQAGEKVYGGVTAHAQIKECNACHAAPWESAAMADRCAACHADISAQMRDVAQLHGAMYHKNPNLGCRHCHPEHRGAAAALTAMTEGDFPHNSLGYSLAGHKLTSRRQPFTCDDCHNGNITTFASDTCLNCHRQIDLAFAQAHLLGFGGDCLACHDGVDRYGKNFNHSSFVFQLTGKHADVTCTKCHLDARTFTDLQSAPQDCYSCHKRDDAHNGEFGGKCEACHSPQGWQPANFDHNLSRFKLNGAHAEAACGDCHKNDVFKGTPSDCYSCHANADAHNGQFGTDCSLCHDPTSWDNVNFDHNRTSFPLTGAHGNIQCTQCHTNGKFKGVSTACVACHNDPVFHAGVFGADCSACHSSQAWSPARFNLSHPQPNTEEGGSGVDHGGASCRTCHPNTVHEFSCLACHNSNNLGEGGGGND